MTKLDISIDEYHNSDGFSRSQLWTYKQLPLKFWHKYISGNYVQTESTALIVGNLFHMLVQEPHLFDEKHIIAPQIDRRTKAGKEAYAKLQEDAKESGRTLISRDIFIEANNMAEAVLKNELAETIIKHKDTEFEKSIYWHDDESKLLLKSRPDILSRGICADLKTTQDASYRGFQSSCVKYGYFLQAGMMKLALTSIGEEMKSFVFICVEKTPPYASVCYFLDDEAIEFGASQCKEIAKQLAESLQNNEFKDYVPEILTLPAYLKGDNNG